MKADNVRPAWRERFAFRRLQTRLIAVILLLVLLLQGAVFIAVSTAASRSARRASDEALQLTATAFKITLDTRRRSLLEKARLMSSDYAFKQVFSEGDHDTLLSALSNHQKRVHADWMVLVSLDGKRIADTLAPEARGDDFEFPQLIEQGEADTYGEAADILFIADKPYQIVFVPLFAPAQIAWIGIGFAITDKWATDLESQTHTQVSLFTKSSELTTTNSGLEHGSGNDSNMRFLSSTLSETQRQDFLAQPLHLSSMTSSSQLFHLGSEDFVTLGILLHEDNSSIIGAALQRSLDDELANFKRLRGQLIGLFALSTLLAIFGAISIARRITQPVSELARGAARIANGEYLEVVVPAQKDELGALALTFNGMVRGLLERDRVRALLGKVVSPAVAEELLNKRIELGGEEREVTLLFSDIRNFTELCEHRAPSEILSMLNLYLTRMSALVDEHDGVVDKYIGDAVMAIYGAPMTVGCDALHALQSALAMQEALPELNQRFNAAGWPSLSIGIGIHSGNAVAGNMGSEARLNYTVLGDTVNLASRLESLTKYYGIGIIVSASTRVLCPDRQFREIDRVRVKGKQLPVTIYEPITQAALWLENWQNAIDAYQSALWPQALALFEAHQQQCPNDPLGLRYIQRCQICLQTPPGPNWDGVYVFQEK